MRNTFTLLISFLTIACMISTAQPADSVFVCFGRKSPAAVQSAADGFYRIPSKKFSHIPVLPGLVLVDPSQLTDHDSVLQLTSYQQLKDNAQRYEIRTKRYPYHQDLYAFREYMREFDLVVRQTDDSTKRVLLDNIHQDSISFLWIDRNRISQGITESYVKYESFLKRIDSIRGQLEPVYAQYRSEQLQPIVAELLKPFYMSNTEISNRQYRAFVEWVRDSIAFSVLYDKLPADQAVRLLNCTKTQLRTIDPNQKIQNLARYGFNYDALDTKKGSFYDEKPYLDLLADLYYPKAERFYKRREFDTYKFIYRSAAISPTPIFPDTLCWLESGTSYFGPYTNMYFWHPAYDNYPIVGLNEAQMRAYCDWLTHRMNETHAGDAYTIKAILPTLYHYEMATKSCTSRSRISTITAYPDSAFVIHRTFLEQLAFIHKNYPLNNPKQVNGEPLRKLYEWHRANQTLPIFYLAGGVSEYCFILEDGDTVMTVLGGNRAIGLVDPHENQLNTVFYQQRVPAKKGTSIVGFRPVFYLEPKTDRQ